jgi:hypothetical protein
VTLIAGRYQPLEAVRAGQPQRARDVTTAQTVLLREVQSTVDLCLPAYARARSACEVFHPALVTLFDVAYSDDYRLLFAYEFVQAQTLAQVGGGQRFAIKRAAGIVAELADAVAALHARGIAHGGITQTTAVVTLKGKAKLDRVADPSVASATATAADDLAALGDLLRELIGAPGAVAGAQAMEVIIARARTGQLESAAALAALLRRL